MFFQKTRCAGIRDWSIQNKLISGFAAVFFFLVFSSGYAVYSLGKIQEKAREVEMKDFTAVHLATALKEIILKLEHHLLDAIVLSKKIQIPQITAQSEKFYILVSEFRSLAGDDPYTIDQLAQVEKLFDQYQGLVVSIARDWASTDLFETPQEAKDLFQEISGDIFYSIDLFQQEYVARLSSALGHIDSLARQIKLSASILGVGAFFFSLFFVILLSRWILRSINFLVEGTKKVSSGEYSWRIPVSSQDELGRLADSYNWMAGSLKESIDRIHSAADRWETDFINSFEEWIIIFNSKGEAVKLNSAAVQVLHLADVPSQGLVLARIPGLSGSVLELQSLFTRAYEEKVEQRREVFESSLGTYLEILMIPILSSQDSDLKIVLIAKNINERKEVEKNQRLAQLGRLVVNVAHEVNNPLMVISGRAQLCLLEDLSNEKVQTDLRTIMSECQRAKTIIQRLLNFSKPSKGERRALDINGVIEGVVGLVDHQFRLDGIEIRKNYASGLPLVLVDEVMIQEVVINLFNNARDAIDKQGWIEVETSRQRDFVKIVIRDNGMGINAKDSSRVLNPFFTTKETGTGLGLSVCYGIVQSHGGELRIQSMPQCGTKVEIFLPAGEAK